MTLIAFLSALGTVLLPILSVFLTQWIHTRQETVDREAITQADTDIKLTLGGDPIGLANLSQQLEQLSREARRKNHS
jgi:hypothetical protein